MWAVGVLTFIILSGKLPFIGRDDHQTLNYIKNGFSTSEFKSQVWERVSDAGKDFISSLLTTDPEERLTAEKALQHPWLANVERPWNP